MAANAVARYVAGTMAKTTSSKKAAKRGGSDKRHAAAKAGAQVAARKAGRPRKDPAKPFPQAQRGTAWVAKVADPRQRALAELAPEVTANMFGVDPGTMFARVPAKDGDVRKGVANSLRELAIGALALLGRDLGLTWSDLHARAGESGRTEVQYLYPAHRWSLCQFAERFARLVGRTADEDGNYEVKAEPVGFVGRAVAEEYRRVVAAAVRRAAEIEAEQAPSRATAAA